MSNFTSFYSCIVSVFLFLSVFSFGWEKSPCGASAPSTGANYIIVDDVQKHETVPQSAIQGIVVKEVRPNKLDYFDNSWFRERVKKEEIQKMLTSALGNTKMKIELSDCEATKTLYPKLGLPSNLFMYDHISGTVLELGNKNNMVRPWDFQENRNFGLYASGPLSDRQYYGQIYKSFELMRLYNGNSSNMPKFPTEAKALLVLRKNGSNHYEITGFSTQSLDGKTWMIPVSSVLGHPNSPYFTIEGVDSCYNPNPENHE